MNITVQGTTVMVENNVVGYELDNLVDTINVTILDGEGNPDTTTIQGQQPTYTMIVYMTLSKVYQTIALNGTYPNLSVSLTSEQLPVSGRYIGQFQTTLGEQVGHTEQFDFWVDDTLNPADVEPKFLPIT